MSDAELNDSKRAKLIQSEIGADATKRKKNDPTLESLEREMQESWDHIAEGTDTATTNRQALFGQAGNGSLVNADAPTRNWRRQGFAKTIVRKLVRRYLHDVVHQLNALHQFQGRLLSELEKRIAKLELSDPAQPIFWEMIAPVAEAEPELCAHIARALSSVQGSVAMVAGGNNSIAEALERPGVAIHALGQHQQKDQIGSGLNSGLGPGVGSPIEDLRAFGDGALGAVVLSSVVESCNTSTIVQLLSEAVRATAANGFVIVAVADPSDRVGPEADLMQGLGLEPKTWAFLLEKHGCSVELLEFSGSRVRCVVVAQVL